MRPRLLDEFVGQAHLVGPNGPLRRLVARRHLPSMVLWGPPGSGKTTLARILAEAVGAEFATLSAVLAGVAEVRAIIAEAQARAGYGDTAAPTVLFIDEIHRFNRAQQDALLPHVEDGTVTLIGATTENAYLSVNPPLLSRLRVFRLEPLSDEEVRAVVKAALSDPRGLAGAVELDEEALGFLVALAGGDARQALNLLEAAVALAEAQGLRTPDGRVTPRRAELEAAAQQRVAGYDLAGDRHYDTVSAFIKSIRGNDPDAALYWLAVMIEAGEDPRFIARRLVIAASEDVGNADPRALQVAVAAAQALEMVGLPEAQYALAQATAYLASAPKSNRAGRAYFAARTDVLEHGALAVPLHLRNAPVARMRSHGIGVGYRYPHDFPGADVEQQYLPDELVGRHYYQPSDQGMEQQIATRLQRLAAARAAARQMTRQGARDGPPEAVRAAPAEVASDSTTETVPQLAPRKNGGEPADPKA
jgi:putative ATPase